MKTITNARGFRSIEHKSYPTEKKQLRILSESSAVDDNNEDGWFNPGSSYLWVGDHHHLSRIEVEEMICYMQSWLDNKRLPEI